MTTPEHVAEHLAESAQRITYLRKKAKAFTAMDVPEDAAEANDEADLLQAEITAWETAQARDRGIIAMDELRALVLESRDREERYAAALVETVTLAAEMRQALERFGELRAHAILGGQELTDVDAIGRRPREPFGLLSDWSLHADPLRCIKIEWGDPDAIRDMHRRGGMVHPTLRDFTLNSVVKVRSR